MGAEAFKIASSTSDPGNSGAPGSRNALRQVNDSCHSTRKDRVSKGDVHLASRQEKHSINLVDSQTDRIKRLTQQLSDEQTSEALAQQQLGATQLVLRLHATTKDLVVAQLRITELEGELLGPDPNWQLHRVPSSPLLPATFGFQIRYLATRNEHFLFAFAGEA
jgi:hypothetical protein